MTTLADINQTLTVQNEMQEKTTKAVDSLNKRFAAFLRIAKGEKLDELEQRREARRESRAMGFARAAGNVAESVKRQTPLLLKILGGAAVAAYILQNKELREAIGGLLSESVQLINETVFQNPEFQRGLKEVGRVVGEAMSAAFVAILPPGLRRFFNDTEINPSVDPSTFNNKDFENENQRFPVEATVGALSAATVAVPIGAKIMGEAYNRAVMEEIIDKRIKAQARTQANEFQKRFAANQANKTAGLSATSKPGFLQRIKNLSKGIKIPGAGMISKLSGPVSGAAIVGGGLLDKEYTEAGIGPFGRIQDQILSLPFQVADVVGSIFGKDLNLNKTRRDIAIAFSDPTEENIDSLNKNLKEMNDTLEEIIKPTSGTNPQPVAPKPSANPQPNFYLDRIVRMGVPYGRNYIPPSQSSLEYVELMQDHMRFQSGIEMPIAKSSQEVKLAKENLATTQSAGSAPIIVAPSSTSSTSNVNQRFDLGMPSAADRAERLTVD